MQLFPTGRGAPVPFFCITQRCAWPCFPALSLLCSGERAPQFLHLCVSFCVDTAVQQHHWICRSCLSPPLPGLLQHTSRQLRSPKPYPFQGFAWLTIEFSSSELRSCEVLGRALCAFWVCAVIDASFSVVLLVPIWENSNRSFVDKLWGLQK